MSKRYVLVVGASGAIGQTIARALARDGWSIYLHYSTNKANVQTVMDELTTTYSEQEFIPAQADFLQQGAAEQLAAQLFTLHAVVIASGHAHYNLLEDTSEEAMRELWLVHVQVPMRLLALTACKLRQHKTSAILFISSIWGDVGAAGETVYSAVKGAQHSFVRAYAREVAMSGTRVNAIAPGIINTSMNAQLTLEEQQEIVADIPLGYIGETIDIAEVASFYVSERASYVTGQIIRVNGGWSM